MVNSSIEEFLPKSSHLIDLRPMSVGEVLSTSVRIYRHLGGKLLPKAIVPTLLMVFATVQLFEVIIPNLLVTSDPNSRWVQGQEIAIILFLLFMLVIPQFATGFGMIISDATALTWKTVFPKFLPPNSDHGGQRLKTVVLAYRVTMQSFGVFGVLALILFGSAVVSDLSFRQASELAGALFLGGLIPAIIMMTISVRNSALAPAVLQVEGGSVRDAVRKSKYLASSDGLVLRTLFPLLLSGLIAWVLLTLGWIALFEQIHLESFLKSVIGGNALGLFLVGLFEHVASALALWFLTPLWGIVLAVLYVESRVRLEGFDIEVLKNA